VTQISTLRSDKSRDIRGGLLVLVDESHCSIFISQIQLRHFARAVLRRRIGTANRSINMVHQELIATFDEYK
jgi:hypothetical protein